MEDVDAQTLVKLVKVTATSKFVFMANYSLDIISN